MTDRKQPRKTELIKHTDNLPTDTESLVKEIIVWKDRFVQAMTSAGDAAVQMGLRFRALKNIEPHGRFGAVLTDIGLTPHDASICMRCAQAAEKHGLIGASASKNHLLLLAQIPDNATPEQLAEAGLDAEDIEKLKAAELGQRVRNLKDQLRLGKEQFLRVAEERDNLQAQIDDTDPPTTKQHLADIQDARLALAKIHKLYLTVPDNISSKAQAALAGLRTEEFTLFRKNGELLESKFPNLQEG